MEMFLYDTEEASPLSAKIRNIDFDYQAEQWVIDTCRNEASMVPGRWMVRWELIDDAGLRAKWERPDGDRGQPTLTHCAERYTGVRPEAPTP